MDRRVALKSWAAAGAIALVAPVARSAPAASSSTPQPQAARVTALNLPPNGGRIPVAFLLSNNAELVDFSGPWGVFEYVHAPGSDEPPFQLYTVAESTTPLKISGGLKITPDYTCANAPQPRIIIIPAQDEPSAATLEWLRQASKGADVTASVCTGAFVLAKAGLLAGREATTHHGALTLLATDFPDIKVKRGARFIDAGNVSTAGGLTSGIDLALHIVERYYGRAVAETTAFWLEYQGQGWKDASSNLAYAARPRLTGAHPRCPVCEMEFSDADLKSAPTEVYKSRTYYFCSPDDKARFDKSPENYAEE